MCAPCSGLMCCCSNDDSIMEQIKSLRIIVSDSAVHVGELLKLLCVVSLCGWWHRSGVRSLVDRPNGRSESIKESTCQIGCHSIAFNSTLIESWASCKLRRKQQTSKRRDMHVRLKSFVIRLDRKLIHKNQYWGDKVTKNITYSILLLLFIVFVFERRLPYGNFGGRHEVRQCAFGANFFGDLIKAQM